MTTQNPTMGRHHLRLALGAGCLTLGLLGWTTLTQAQLPVTGTMRQGSPSLSGGAWPVVPAQAAATMTKTQTSAANAAWGFTFAYQVI